MPDMNLDKSDDDLGPFRLDLLRARPWETNTRIVYVTPRRVKLVVFMVCGC